MYNETPRNPTSSDSKEAKLNSEKPKSIPALDPFEVMYSIGSERTIIVPLVPPPNPRMLEGIDKKRPSRSLVALVVSCWTQAFAKSLAFLRRLFGFFKRWC